MDKPVLMVKKLVDDMETIRYHTPEAAGIDLHSSELVSILPNMIMKIKTGIKLQIPKGWEVQVRGRSGLAFNHLVFVTHLGTIDSDYRGEIYVLLENKGLFTYTVGKNDRIAQMVLNRAEQAEILIVENIDSSDRGEEGFGSTGK